MMVNGSPTDRCRGANHQLAITGCGHPTFIQHYELAASVTSDMSYVSGNNMYFGVHYEDQRISKVACETSKQLDKHHEGELWSQISSNGYWLYVVPVILEVFNLSEIIKNKQEWHSDPFFAFEGGYKIYLKVYPAGNKSGEDGHISVGLVLMKGPYDDDLEQSGHFPLRGTFTIELLNQLNDKNHHSRNVTFDDANDFTNRVAEGDRHPIGLEIVKFIFHKNMLHGGYLKTDNIYFRVRYNS